MFKKFLFVVLAFVFAVSLFATDDAGVIESGILEIEHAIEAGNNDSAASIAIGTGISDLADISFGIGYVFKEGGVMDVNTVSALESGVNLKLLESEGLPALTLAIGYIFGSSEYSVGFLYSHEIEAFAYHVNLVYANAAAQEEYSADFKAEYGFFEKLTAGLDAEFLGLNDYEDNGALNLAGTICYVPVDEFEAELAVSKDIKHEGSGVMFGLTLLWAVDVVK